MLEAGAEIVTPVCTVAATGCIFWSVTQRTTNINLIHLTRVLSSNFKPFISSNLPVLTMILCTSLQTRTRRHREISAAAEQSFSSTTRRRSHHRVSGAGRRRDGAGSTPGEPSRMTRTRKTIRMTKSATFGSSTSLYSAISSTRKLR